MKYADKKSIASLLKLEKKGQSVSIFLPTHRIPLAENTKSDKLRLKNAIQFTLRSLDGQVSDADLKDIKSQLNSIYKDASFWKNRDHGLAIYVTTSSLVYFDLPIEIDASTHISDNFIIAPLLAADYTSYTYYVLDVNQHQPRLFKGTQTTFEQLLKKEMPRELADALNIDEYSSSLQHGTSNGGSRDAHYHGHGDDNDYKQKDINRYYRKVAQVVYNYELHDKKSPLMFAGDTQSIKVMRKVLAYKHTYKSHLSGNHSNTPTEQLHRQSWEVMTQEIKKNERNLRRRVDRTMHVVNNLDDILNAITKGQLAWFGISLVHQSYDSVINRMERQFKVTLPSNFEQLKKIEDAIRHSLNNGAEITSYMFRNSDMKPAYGFMYK